MQSIVAKNGQNLLDVTIMHCGSLESAFKTALLNGMSITDEPLTGQKLFVPDINNTAVVEYFAVNKYMPATNEVVEESTVDEGIGFWEIGIDFIIG